MTISAASNDVQKKDCINSYCQRKSAVPSWRRGCAFSLFQRKEQAAFAAVVPQALLGRDQARFAQILQRAAHSRLRQLQFSGDGGDRRPAFPSLLARSAR